MKTNINQIIRDMHTEDSTQVENFDKVGFVVGGIREEYETSQGTQFGKPYCYIKSAGICFPISEDSAKTIIAKMTRLANLKKYVEEAKKDREEK